MLKFKNADPTRRIPVYLQNGTKENLVWQLKLTAVLFVVLQLRDWWEDRQERKKYAHL